MVPTNAYKYIEITVYTVCFAVLITSKHFLLDYELLTEIFYVYHPIKHQRFLTVITYISVFLKYWFL
jgi:hypothetical protein